MLMDILWVIFAMGYSKNYLHIPEVNIVHSIFWSMSQKVKLLDFRVELSVIELNKIFVYSDLFTMRTESNCPTLSTLNMSLH